LAVRNKKVFDLFLNNAKLLQKCKSVSKVSQITDAHWLKAQTILVAGTVKSARDADLTVILVPVT